MATAELTPAVARTTGDSESAAAPTDGASEVEAGDDGDGPEWPDEAVESAMRAEERERAGDSDNSSRVRPSRAADVEEEAEAPLPKLEALVAQLPADLRESLDELFRARFTSVQRVPKSALK